MYNRRVLVCLLLITSALSIATELIAFFYLFLQFSNILSGLSPSVLMTHDVIFFAFISGASLWVHELIEATLALGDKLEARGEVVWKTKTASGMKSEKKPPSSS